MIAGACLLVTGPAETMLATADRVMMDCENFMLAKSEVMKLVFYLRAAEKLMKRGTSADR